MLARVGSRLWSLTVQKILATIHTLVTAHNTMSVCSVMHCLSHVPEGLCTGKKPCHTRGICIGEEFCCKFVNGSIITAQSSCR